MQETLAESNIFDNDQAEQEEQDRIAKLAGFASTLTSRRKEAIDGRKASGIEDMWLEDDEYYNGIDDANRAESMLKPATSAGRVVIRSNNTSTRSTVFVNITQSYCDMASARVSDMLLPTNDKPFSISPTPIPEMAGSTDSQELMPGGNHTVGEASKAFLADMDKKAQLAETQIWDWIVEARWHSEMRKVIEQSARIGTGCLKGPFPVKKRNQVVKHLPEGISLIIEEVIKPASRMIDVWNLYPDPSCGESIHDGNYIFEKDLISAKKLRDLKGTGYIDSEIDAVLKEGPRKKNIDSKGVTIDTDSFEIWYYTGTADAEDLRAAHCHCEDGASMPVVVAMVNDRIIKASVSILNSGEFPYDVMCWKPRVGSWTGVGVARQVRTSQRMVIAATRNLMDNAGVSAGPQIVLKKGIVKPADGEWTITPLKIWWVDEDADIAQAAHAITTIVIPTMQAELDNIIKLALDFAERSTSMPLILQGQQGGNTHTVGGMNILQNNSTSVLRNIAKTFDDNISEPHITRYYEWLMIYGKDDSMKGDFNIISQGSSAFYERDSQNQAIMQLMPMAANPAFGINPEKLMTEILKMNKISPERVQYSDEELKQMKQAAQQNPPQNPAIQVAQIRAKTEMDKAQLTQQGDAQEAQSNQHEMESEMSLKLHIAQLEQDHQMKLKQIDYNIEMMRLSQAQNISLDQIKAELAGTSMKLQVQQKLSAQDMAATGHSQAADHAHEKAMQVLTPPTEPVGRAQPGHAFEQ